MNHDTERLTRALFDEPSDTGVDPFALFEEWLALARTSEVNDPTAMALATVDADGMPDLRMVLLNARDERGFVFFTNLDSAKASQLRAAPRAALLFHWKSLRRQVRIRGSVEPVSAAEADAYFATRPLQSRLGAHASQQSQPLQSRGVLEARVEELRAQYGDSEVPRPENWSGFRIRPSAYEFWKDGAFRLHDRFRYSRDGEAAAWSCARLYP
ncbi:pyridoxamine 5'-phosphate oxidase [Pelagibacterium montanilacus]|uniref:pyridoxamine 5'-phosphate oxidase n=1 Tax=Pelagibacterium montanilacus TaxID=2185280 RepID=UPI000F8F0CF4|nr:pyridoxamine 5'-phosphate oxidase [Pelagibacterium montanilacus]